MNSSHYFNLVQAFKNGNTEQPGHSRKYDDEDCSGSDESLNHIGLTSPVSSTSSTPSSSPPSMGFCSPSMSQTSPAHASQVPLTRPATKKGRFFGKLASHLHRSGKGPQEHISVTNGYERLD